ncbi:TetR/AcrR family transcriptional regulator [Rhodococcus sp. IEGM 1379]|uniref:TetR/AcrR family transcriptional regulator n=1 Tax=Rhodococcus sp. IEGM 1379 TaxID=3047086 RepID=UPI0024B6D834|nr:TetR/AcrR family transcriptional regulator [Rhodococcus sp. IEGM 1379]MDI9914235.1 TetR/AcrR family transcriptional regulator [Rhodococcus sp. IEGM 1379]
MEWSERHDLILGQAASLFATKGIAGTPVRDIADGVGILSGSLYHYFESKDAIAYMIVSRYLDDLTARYEAITDADPRDRLTSIVHASLAASVAHPHASEIYQNNSEYLRKLPGNNTIRSAARTTKATWMDAIASGIEAGQLRADLPADVIYGLMRDAVWLSLRWFTPTKNYSIEQFGDTLISVFLEGIEPQE